MNHGPLPYQSLVSGGRRGGLKAGTRQRPFQDQPGRGEGWAPHPMQSVTCDYAQPVGDWQWAFGPGCRRSGSDSEFAVVSWAYARSARFSYLAMSCAYTRAPWRTRATVGPTLGPGTFRSVGVGNVSRAIHRRLCPGRYSTPVVRTWQLPYSVLAAGLAAVATCASAPTHASAGPIRAEALAGRRRLLRQWSADD